MSPPPEKASGVTAALAESFEERCAEVCVVMSTKEARGAVEALTETTVGRCDELWDAVPPLPVKASGVAAALSESLHGVHTELCDSTLPQPVVTSSTTVK